MQVDDPPTGEFPAGGGRNEAHVSRQHDVIDLVLINETNESIVVGAPLNVADVMPVD